MDRDRGTRGAINVERDNLQYRITILVLCKFDQGYVVSGIQFLVQSAPVASGRFA